MNGKVAIAILVLTLMISSGLASGTNVRTLDDNPVENTGMFGDAEVYIYVDYVTNDYNLGLDELDGFGSWNPEPEWGYKIKVIDDQGYSKEIEKWHDQSVYTWNVGKTHTFSGCTSNSWIHIYIDLLDDDGILPDEEADISKRSGGERSFWANYDLETNTLSGMYDEGFEDLGNDYYLLNGDLDGTGGHNNDDNDAHMKIKITDNYSPLDVELNIKNSLENGNIPPGEEVTFEVTVTGGLGPFEYTFYPYYSGQSYTKNTDNRIVEFKHTYSGSDHGGYRPFIVVEDSQNGVVSEESYIIVNKRPSAPTKITRSGGRILGYYYEAVGASDLDNDQLQYRWNLDGQLTDWSIAKGLNSNKKYGSVKVRVRDDPPGPNNIQFEDGLESNWCTRARSRSIDFQFFNFVFEKLSNNLPSFIQILQRLLV